nr:HAD-IIIC family phosphatase [Streptomyces phaeoluteigriseus]
MCATALGEGAPHGGPTVVEAPYHQVLAALRDPSGVFADPRTAVGVVLLRAPDLERFGPVDDALLTELRTEYPAALRAVAERTRKPLIVGFLPAVRTDERLTRWERETAGELAALPGIAVLRPDDFTRRHPVAERFDERTERLAHLPFTPPFQAAVALCLAETVRSVLRPAPKVIAVDGDETLWGGVAGEIGPDAVDLTGPRALLARRLLQWREAGALLALVSNNDEDTVRAVLDRPDSLLTAEHFSVLSAAWGPKPTRVAEAARTLGLGVDSFLFLDDNPAEIGRMRAALPEVLSVTCPPAAELEDFLARLWPLVPAPATAEDALRARFYDQERERDTVREQAGFEEFLAQLQLEVDVRALGEETCGGPSNSSAAPTSSPSAPAPPTARPRPVAQPRRGVDGLGPRPFRRLRPDRPARRPRRRRPTRRPGLADELPRPRTGRGGAAPRPARGPRRRTGLHQGPPDGRAHRAQRPGPPDRGRARRRGPGRRTPGDRHHAGTPAGVPLLGTVTAARTAGGVRGVGGVREGFGNSKASGSSRERTVHIVKGSHA